MAGGGSNLHGRRGDGVDPASNAGGLSPGWPPVPSSSRMSPTLGPATASQAERRWVRPCRFGDSWCSSCWPGSSRWPALREVEAVKGLARSADREDERLGIVMRLLADGLVKLVIAEQPLLHCLRGRVPVRSRRHGRGPWRRAVRDGGGILRVMVEQGRRVAAAPGTVVEEVNGDLHGAQRGLAGHADPIARFGGSDGAYHVHAGAQQARSMHGPMKNRYAACACLDLKDRLYSAMRCSHPRTAARARCIVQCGAPPSVVFLSSRSCFRPRHWDDGNAAPWLL